MIGRFWWLGQRGSSKPSDMFTLGKLAEAALAPSGVLIAMGLAAILWLHTRHWRLGRRVLTGIAVLWAVLCVLPLGWWMTLRLEERFPRPEHPPAHVDGIIVLGGPVLPALSQAWGQVSLGDSAERMTEMAALMLRYPDARAIFTGGSGNPFEPEALEAPWVRVLMAALGADLQRISFESRSRNTHENALFSKDMMQPAAGEVWVLVTSAAHMPRAEASFQSVGWSVVPWSVDYRTDPQHPPWLAPLRQMDLITYAVHEWIGLVYYHLRGWSPALLPSPDLPRGSP